MPSIIPLTNNPSDIFRIDIDGRDITLQTMFNIRAEARYWTLDIYEDGVLLVPGKALLLSVDILGKRPELKLGSLIPVSAGSSEVEATYESLGTDVVLVHLTEAEKKLLEEEAQLLLVGGEVDSAFSTGFEDEAFL
jgi:hypothetical protein